MNRDPVSQCGDFAGEIEGAVGPEHSSISSRSNPESKRNGVDTQRQGGPAERVRLRDSVREGWVGDPKLAAAEVELGRVAPGIPLQQTGFEGIQHVTAIAA